MSGYLSPDVKRRISEALAEGTLDPHDTLSVTEKAALREAIAPEKFTYRLFVDVEITSHEEADLEELERQAKSLAAGFESSDAFPDPSLSAGPGATFRVLGADVDAVPHGALAVYGLANQPGFTPSN